MLHQGGRKNTKQTKKKTSENPEGAKYFVIFITVSGRLGTAHIGLETIAIFKKRIIKLQWRIESGFNRILNSAKGYITVFFP